MPKWNDILNKEQAKPYYQRLFAAVENEYNNYEVYPPRENILNALTHTPYDNVKCVILGQDPYHEKGQAMGLSFSVNKNITIPPSLQNIYKEIDREYHCGIPSDGDLTVWADQGVLLLNAILTVRARQAASHRNIGWEEYTDAIIRALNESDKPIVFMLWGNFAKEKSKYLNNPKHLVLKTSHPSPYSVNYGFSGCNHFIKCNEFLAQNGIQPIDWTITTRKN